jgi:hypothetical protein
MVNEVVTEAEPAVCSNNANEFNNIPDGADIDTYSGVNGNGAPLPAYFGKGTSSAQPPRRRWHRPRARVPSLRLG